MRTDPIDQIWIDFRAGRISAEEMVANQNELMPRCRGCGAEPMHDAHTGLGAACYAKMCAVRLPSSESCMRRRGR